MTSRLRATLQHLRLAALAVGVTVSSCAVPSPSPPSPEVSDQLAKIDASQIPLAEFGQLPVFVTDQTTDGRNVKLRGLVFNPYAETIGGVRLVFRVLPAADATARELDRFQKVTSDQIPPRGKVALRFDVQTMYAGQGGRWGFELLAFAIKRGGQDLPPPPDWRESR